MWIGQEGFGPEKVAVIVEALTDNKNRTASNIRTIFQKAGGNLGTKGSASHNFNQLGVIKVNKKGCWHWCYKVSCNTTYTFLFLFTYA